MRIGLLGVMSVSHGDARVAGAALGGRRARLVLAALATSDQPVGADALSHAVWGDARPETWSVALRGTVRALRTALAPLVPGGAEVVATVPSGYALAPDVDVDLRVGATAVTRAEALLAQGRPQAALAEATGPAALRGAALLPEESAGWLVPIREAVDAGAVRALEVMSRAASMTGEHARAVDAARRAIELAPLTERTHRSLIHALARAGDRAAAISAFEACRSLLADELGVDPSPETVAAYLEATAGQARSVPAGIPDASTTFVGRLDDARRLAGAAAGPGLITLVGRGGVGKSRLAAEVVRSTGAAGRTFWVALATVADDALVAVTVALHLELDAAGDPAVAIAGYLAPLGRATLVLDGADVVLDGAATLAVALAEACPMLTVLVTSRTVLGVGGEQVLPVDPLPAPRTAGLLADEPQIALLVDRVAAAGGTLPLDATARPAVLDLCRRCAGLPLALELAAAQLADMALEDLLEHLTEQPDQLRAVTTSSCAQLDDQELAVFRRWAVLEGPVALSFARAVLSGVGVPPERLVRILTALGARGLISIDHSGPRRTYSQDDDVHRYARELLAAAGEEAERYDRLADAVRALLPDDARAAPGPFANAVSAVLGSVRSLFGAALAGRADTGPSLELAFRLHRYWAATSVAEGRMWLGRLLDAAATDAPWRPHATYALGYLGYWAGDTDAALRDLRAAVGLFGAEPDPLIARALIYTAGLLDDLDRPAEAIDHVRRAMVAAEPFGTDLFVAAAMGLGSVLSERADPTAARYAGEAVARCRVDGSDEQLAALLPTAAMVCWQVGALDDARAYLTEAWPLHAEHKRIARVVLLSTAAGLALADGDLDAAVDHGRSADAEGSELGVEREMPLIRALLARALLRRGDLAGAADRALAGLDVAAGMTVTFPLAIGLETAALIGAAAGVEPETLGALVATAAAIRAGGDRPASVPIAADLAGVPPGTEQPIAEAIVLARRVLAVAGGL